MEQDLLGVISWLNSRHDDSEGSQGARLLLAPLSDEHPDVPAMPERGSMPDNLEQELSDFHDEPAEQDAPSDEAQNDQTVTQESYAEQAEDIAQELHELQEAVMELGGAQEHHDLEDTEPSHELTDDTQHDTPELSPTQNDEQEDEPIPQDKEWQERATGFTLSLDEPPPELWTNINDDDEELDYEPTDSLQGAAYVQIHGRNFTDRLHNTLKHRKERAEERAEAERSNAPEHPYRQKALFWCGLLVMTVCFAWPVLWLLNRETPEGMSRRALSLVEQGNYGEAANIYRKAYRRYPKVLTFLTGLAECSEKSGHIQTAVTAWQEYINALPEDDKAHRENAEHELRRIKGEGDTEQKPTVQKNEIVQEARQEKPLAIIPLKKQEVKPERQIPREAPMTFDEYLSEANHAYNIGMYSRAVVNFFRAMEINSRDIRPYIGLAGAYMAKGMYFDCKRILDEARRIFRRNPTIEMGYKYLREAK